MASAWTNKGLHEIASGATDWLTDTIKLLLVDEAYAFDGAAHEFVADVSASELSGTGYAGGFAGAGRRTLAGKAVNRDDANNRVAFDADDPSAWTGLDAGTVGGVIIYRNGTSDADSPILGFLDPADLVTNGGNVTLTFDATGILRIARA